MSALPSVLAMGEVMVELSPQAQGGFALGYAGDTFNTAIHLARQGFDVGYLTELGRDRFSDAIVAQAESEAVAMGGCVRSEGDLPGLYLIENNPDGEREFFYWRDNSAARKLLTTPNQVRHAIAVASAYDLFYISGISLAVMGQGAGSGFWQLLEALHKQGKSIIFDPNYRPRLWPDAELAKALYMQVLDYCDVVFPTLDDEQELWGLSDAAAIVDFYQSLGVTEVVIKLPGAESLVWRQGKISRAASDYAGQVLDTTGAGDAFNAGYLKARYVGTSAKQALQAGHGLASQVIAVSGAIPPRDSHKENKH